MFCHDSSIYLPQQKVKKTGTEVPVIKPKTGANRIVLGKRKTAYRRGLNDIAPTHTAGLIKVVCLRFDPKCLQYCHQ